MCSVCVPCFFFRRWTSSTIWTMPLRFCPSSRQAWTLTLNLPVWPSSAKSTWFWSVQRNYYDSWTRIRNNVSVASQLFRFQRLPERYRYLSHNFSFDFEPSLICIQLTLVPQLFFRGLFRNLAGFILLNSIPSLDIFIAGQVFISFYILLVSSSCSTVPVYDGIYSWTIKSKRFLSDL